MIRKKWPALRGCHLNVCSPRVEECEDSVKILEAGVGQHKVQTSILKKFMQKMFF